MSGVKGKSGRKHKSLTRERALQVLTMRLPKAINVIAETIDGVNTDRLRYESAVEVKNSVMGKPTQQNIIRGGEQIGENLVAQLFTRLEAKQRELRESAAQKQLAKESQAEIHEI